MTLATNPIIPQEIVVTDSVYEPTVEDRIQRVLYRLDNGEDLCKGYLHFEDKFCVLGLFMDESGLGEWILDEVNSQGFKFDDQNIYYAPEVLPGEIVAYYGFSDDVGQFELNSLPTDLREDIIRLFPTAGYDRQKITCLTALNDDLMTHNIDTSKRNDILARVIRSGVVFKDAVSRDQQ